MSCVVTFDGEVLANAITCADPSPLRDLDTRGKNRVMPGADGTRAIEPHIDELDRTLTWHITGRVDHTGSTHADREAGLTENLEFYRSLFDPRGGTSGTGLYTISVAFGSDVFTGQAQVRQYGQVRTGPTTASIITRLVITAGELIATP